MKNSWLPSLSIVGLWSLGFSALAFAPCASAQTVAYNNGAPNQANGNEMTSFIEANEFAISDLTTIGSIRFWEFEPSLAFAGSVYWSFNTNNAGVPGTPLFTGLASNVSHAATGLSVSGFPEYVNTFSIPAALLPVGVYWLELHNGPLSNMSSPPNLFWETTSATTGLGSAYLYEPFTGAFHRSGSSTENAFVLYAIPEPSIWALLGVGLAGLGAALRLRSRAIR